MKRDVIYAFSDLHLTNKNSKFRTKNGVSDLLKAQKNFCQGVADKAKEQDDLRCLAFLGDWSDYTDFDPVMQQYSNDCFDTLCVDKVDNIFVTGNHTVYGSKNAYSVLSAKQKLVESSQIEVADNSCRIDRSFDHDYSFYCIPYQEDYDAIVETIAGYNKELDDSRVNILFFHFPTMGAKLDNKVLAQSGVPVKEHHLSNFDLCIGGDYHRPQQVYPNFYYVGAPFSLKFGENDCHRGFVKIVVEDGDIELERVDNEWNYQMVYAEDVKSVLDLVEKKPQKELRRMIVKMQGELSEEKRVKLNEVSDSFYRLVLPPVGQKNKESDKENERLEVDKMEVFEKNDDVKQLKKNIDQRDISKDRKQRAIELFSEEIIS